MHAILHARRKFDTLIADMREQGTMTLAIEHHADAVSRAFREFDLNRGRAAEVVSLSNLRHCYAAFEREVLRKSAQARGQCQTNR